MEEEVFQLTKAKPIESGDEDNNNAEGQQNAAEESDDDLMLIPKKKVKPQPVEEREINELSNHFGNVVEVTPTETQEEQPEYNQSQEIKPKLQKPKKALTGYFLFLKDYKSREDKGTNASVNIHKDLASIWSTMSLDEKQKYNLLAQEEQKRYNQEMEAYKASLGDDYEGGSDGEDNHTTLMTIGKVKKIIKADPEIRKVSKASCEYIIKLTEAFGSFLLQEVEKNMKAENKKKPGMNDLVHVSRKVPGLMFLDDAKIFPDYEAQKLEREMKVRTEKESKKKAEKENKEGAEIPEPRKTAEKEKKKAVVQVANNKKISDFFGRSNN